MAQSLERELNGKKRLMQTTPSIETSRICCGSLRGPTIVFQKLVLGKIGGRKTMETNVYKGQSTEVFFCVQDTSSLLFFQFSLYANFCASYLQFTIFTKKMGLTAQLYFPSSTPLYAAYNLQILDQDLPQDLNQAG